MLSRVNICHGRVHAKEVCMKCIADTEEQLGVNGGLVVDALEGAGRGADLLGEPLIGITLAAELVAEKVAYVYLHDTICFYHVGYRFFIYTPTTADKKEGEQSRLLTAAVGYR